jgi:hypothetical protein
MLILFCLIPNYQYFSSGSQKSIPSFLHSFFFIYIAAGKEMEFVVAYLDVIYQVPSNVPFYYYLITWIIE